MRIGKIGEVSSVLPIFMSSEFLAEHDVAESLGKNLGIKPPGAMFQVVEVEVESAQHLLHGVSIAIVERGIRGDTRAYLI